MYHQIFSCILIVLLLSSNIFCQNIPIHPAAVALWTEPYISHTGPLVFRPSHIPKFHWTAGVLHWHCLFMSLHLTLQLRTDTIEKAQQSDWYWVYIGSNHHSTGLTLLNFTLGWKGRQHTVRVCLSIWSNSDASLPAEMFPILLKSIVWTFWVTPSVGQFVLHSALWRHAEFSRGWG